jgi:hypothetical protein
MTSLASKVDTATRKSSINTPPPGPGTIAIVEEVTAVGSENTKEHNTATVGT